MGLTSKFTKCLCPLQNASGCVAVVVLFIVNEKRKEPDVVPVVVMTVVASWKMVCCGFVVYLKREEEGEMKIWGNFQFFRGEMKF